jgi:hypothetical protein
MSLFGSDDSKNFRAPLGSDLGLPRADRVAGRLIPLSDRYPHIIPLSSLDLNAHYACLRCQHRFVVPLLMVERYDFVRGLGRELEKHELCEVDMTWRWSALGELLG